MQATTRFYPGLDLGVVIMSNMEGSWSEDIVDGLVNAWLHEAK
jgi:hypothetical protein